MQKFRKKLPCQYNNDLTFISRFHSYFSDEVIHTAKISKPTFAFLSPSTQKLHYDTLKNHTTITKFIVFGDSATKEISFDKLTLDDPNGNVMPADFYGKA